MKIIIWIILLSLSLAFSGQSFADHTIKVMSYNIGEGVHTLSGKKISSSIYRLIQEVNPDILAIQELSDDPGKIAQVAGLKYFFPVSYKNPNNWNGRGVCVYSRWPLKGQGIRLKTSNRCFAQTMVSFKNVELSFYNVHLSRFDLGKHGLSGLLEEFSSDGPRVDQMKNLVSILSKDQAKYKILAGDLNAFPRSTPYKLLSEVLADSFAQAFDTIAGTYRFELNRNKSMRRFPNPKIDHIFYGPGFTIVEAHVIKKGMSDHYPVIAVFRIND